MTNNCYYILLLLVLIIYIANKNIIVINYLFHLNILKNIYHESQLFYCFYSF